MRIANGRYGLAIEKSRRRICVYAMMRAMGRGRYGIPRRGRRTLMLRHIGRRERAGAELQRARHPLNEQEDNRHRGY